jgi:hypothetical protein
MEIKHLHGVLDLVNPGPVTLDENQIYISDGKLINNIRKEERRF